MNFKKIILGVSSLILLMGGSAKADPFIRSHHVKRNYFSHHVVRKPVVVERHVRRVHPVRSRVVVNTYNPVYREPCDHDYYSTSVGYYPSVPMPGYYTQPGFSWGVSFGNSGFNGGYFNSRW